MMPEQTPTAAKGSHCSQTWKCFLHEPIGINCIAHDIK